MANFTKYTNYRNDAGVSSVVFGANSTVLEVELNEMQEIQKHMLRDILNHAIGNGITDVSKLTLDNNVLKIGDCGIICNGYFVYCNGLEYNIENDGDTIYLLVWEETVDYLSKLTQNGYSDGSEVENWIKDSRADNETTKRKVVKYTLSNTASDDISYIPIAKYSAGSIEVLINEINLGKVKNNLDEAISTCAKGSGIELGVTDGILTVTYDDGTEG